MNKSKNLLIYMTIAGMVWLVALAFFPASNALAQKRPDGAKLYAERCGTCHPGGGNTINAAFPVAGSRHMKSLDAFIKFNRKPLKADGSKGVMPAFSKEDVSDQDMKLIYEYAKKLPPVKK